MFTDNEFKDHILEARKTLGFSDITHIVVQELDKTWSFSYLEQVKKNREIYFPTRDDRTSAESHIITCNKFDFVLQGITLNPFNTSKFGWIDSFLSNEAGNGLRICEDYTLDKFLYVINNITEKFHIQILNVNGKKYKNESLKHDYYSCYRYVVCGGFFTCGIEIGTKILTRLKENFVKTTELGYGHGEEMLYLEILDDFYDDIEKGYGDYGQMINNILYPTKNLHYVLHLIVYNYLNYGYYRECYDCCKKIIYSIEKLNTPVDNDFYVNILLSYLTATYYYKKDEALQILNKIDTIVTTNNEIKLIYDNLKNNFVTCHFMNLQDFDDFYELLQKNNYFIETKPEPKVKYENSYVFNKYKKLCNIKSDINEHLPTLYEYALQCESILELGVRGVISSWAFLNGLINNNKNKKELFFNDIESCDINELLKYSKNKDVVIEYEWIDDLKLEFDDNRTFDMVFIDTWHVYAQLKRELEKYSKITNKYIIMHDTETDAIVGETIRNGWNANEQSEITGFSIDEINCGLNKAVYNFLYENKNWRMLKHYVNNNGLTILEKIS